MSGWSAAAICRRPPWPLSLLRPPIKTAIGRRYSSSPRHDWLRVPTVTRYTTNCDLTISGLVRGDAVSSDHCYRPFGNVIAPRGPLELGDHCPGRRRRNDQPDRHHPDDERFRPLTCGFGAPGRTRTCNLRIRSRPTAVHAVFQGAVHAGQVRYTVQPVGARRALFSRAE
jgi:hypothetical protein